MLFAVLLGDDIIDHREHLLERMLQVHVERSTSVLALMEVEPKRAHLHSVATVEATDENNIVRVRGLVEKPEPRHGALELRDRRSLRSRVGAGRSS